MRRLLICSSILASALALAGCGSDSTTAAAGTTSGTTGAGGGTTGSGGAGSTTSGATTGAGGSAPVVTAYKSYVILGDSISDHGGVGPFFYDILATNDDVTYPNWKGKDLTIVSAFEAAAQEYHAWFNDHARCCCNAYTAVDASLRGMKPPALPVCPRCHIYHGAAPEGVAAIPL